MQLPQIHPVGLSTIGLTGIALMVLHITSFLTGWAWPILYIFLILAAHGHELGQGWTGSKRRIE